MRSLNRIVLPALIAVFLVCAVHSVLGAPAAQYPGAKLTVDVNLTDKDFLPVLKQLLTTIPGAIPTEMKAGAPVPVDQIAADIAGALAGVKTLKVSGYALQSADSGKIAQFYGEKTGAGKDWKPMAILSGMSLYLKPAADQMFFLITYPDGFFTASTTGPLDFGRLAKVATQLMPMVSQAAPDQPASVRTASTVQGAPYGSQGVNAGAGISWEVHGSADVTMQLPDGKGAWQDSGQIATTPADAPAVPRLIVRSKTGVLSMGGYATYEVQNAQGKSVMRLVIKPRDPKMQAGPSEVRVVSFAPDPDIQ